MENHPIPQDVTGFQFRLIGDMTVKQFAYLAGGSGLAWLTLILPMSMLIKLPVAFLFFTSGASLAFLPVAGRPLDTMLSLFIRALFIPNLYVYQKQGGNIALFDIYLKPHKKTHKKEVEKEKSQTELLQTVLKSLPKKPKDALDEKETVFFESLSSLLQHGTTPPPTAPNGSAHIISIHEEKPIKKEEPMQEMPRQEEVSQIEKEAKVLEEELLKAKKQESDQAQKGQAPEGLHQKVTSLEEELQKVLGQKAELEQQFIELQKKLAQSPKQVFTPTTLSQDEETPRVHKIPKGMGTKVGIPIAPEAPNVILGIVKDPRGNVLPNILVEIKDKEQNPVRAFKTNPLGQFQSATPLLNGTYTIEFEDPEGRHKFDIIEISADGEVIMPIEILSVDQREELRRSLFGMKN